MRTLTQCAYIAADHHSDDLVEVYYGSPEPTLLCGFHETYFHTEALEFLSQPVWGVWYGGTNYATSRVEEHLEVFANLEDARDAMSSRVHMGHRYPQTFTYADGRRENVLCPVVTGSRLEIFYADPSAHTSPTADLILEQGEDDETIEEKTA